MGETNTEYGADQIQILEVWKPYVRDLVCTLEVHPAVVSIILYTKSWTMP